MFGLSWGEIGLTAILLFFILGAGKVPRVGESVGAFVSGYRKGRREEDPEIGVREKES